MSAYKFKVGYQVYGGDPAGPRDWGTYDTFAEALKVYEAAKAVKGRNYVVDGIWGPDADDCWNGLTEEEEEQL